MARQPSPAEQGLSRLRCCQVERSRRWRQHRLAPPTCSSGLELSSAAGAIGPRASLKLRSLGELLYGYSGLYSWDSAPNGCGHMIGDNNCAISSSSLTAVGLGHGSAIWRAPRRSMLLGRPGNARVAQGKKAMRCSQKNRLRSYPNSRKASIGLCPREGHIQERRRQLARSDSSFLPGAVRRLQTARDWPRSEGPKFRQYWVQLHSGPWQRILPHLQQTFMMRPPTIRQ